MQITSYEEGREFKCHFRGYYFELSRDPNDGFSYGNWYARVTDSEGVVIMDEWIDDSSSLGHRKSMEEVCDAFDIQLPKVWPVDPHITLS